MKQIHVLKHTYLILKEHASHFFSTTKMIILWTPIVKATHCGPLDAASSTLNLKPPLVSTVHIHQGPIQSLVHLRRPQGTVQMGIAVYIHVQQSVKRDHG